MKEIIGFKNNTQKYYESLQLSESDQCKRMRLVGRHRGTPRPPTPEHFWELEIPSTEECIRRGYMDAEAQPYVFQSHEKKY